MKKVIIGDIHGLATWKDIVEVEGDCEYIFLGDYVDSYDVSTDDQVTNLLEVLQFKKDNPDKVTLILGNHDFHYINTSNRYSGWRHNTYTAVNPVYMENLELFEVLHDAPEALYSHAGLTEAWLKYFPVPEDLMYGPLTSERQSAYTSERRGMSYEYAGPLGKLQFNYITGMSPYGDQTSSSPIWVRPDSLLSNHRGLKPQVVGHTHISDIHSETTEDGFVLWLCDALHARQYLVYDNNEFTVKTI